MSFLFSVPVTLNNTENMLSSVFLGTICREVQPFNLNLWIIHSNQDIVLMVGGHKQCSGNRNVRDGHLKTLIHKSQTVCRETYRWRLSEKICPSVIYVNWPLKKNKPHTREKPTTSYSVPVNTASLTFWPLDCFLLPELYQPTVL